MSCGQRRIVNARLRLGPKRDPDLPGGLQIRRTDRFDYGDPLRRNSQNRSATCRPILCRIGPGGPAKIEHERRIRLCGSAAQIVCHEAADVYA